MILHCVNFVYFGAYFSVAAGLQIKLSIVVAFQSNELGEKATIKCLPRNCWACKSQLEMVAKA